MSVYRPDEYPWMKAEIQLIRQAVECGKTVLGICLGAQLIAAALNAAVRPHVHREIGWFTVTRTTAAEQTYLAPSLPQSLEAFHWHGDTFELPRGAVPLARSRGCENQGFLFGERVVGLQFHPEMTPEVLRELIRQCGDEIGQGPWEQPPAKMIADGGRFAAANQVMFDLLDALAQRCKKPNASKA
jgi:GMP synthase (glutamine-hydrolysing)